MAVVNPLEFGGAHVRRRISRPDGDLMAGAILTREDLLKLPINNLRALIDNHTIAPWPYVPPGKLHLIHVGRGYYDVIEGEKLNAESMLREDAEALIASRQTGPDGQVVATEVETQPVN